MKFVLAELLSELHLSMEHLFPEGFLQCWVWSSSRPQLAALCWESLTYVIVLNYEKSQTRLLTLLDRHCDKQPLELPSICHFLKLPFQKNLPNLSTLAFKPICFLPI